MSSVQSLCNMAKKIVEKVFIDGDLVVRGGTFFCRNIAMYVPIDNADNVDKIIGGDLIKDGFFETYENYGSPYIDYYIKGGATMAGGSIIMNPDKDSDSLIYIAKQELNKIKDLLNVNLPNTDLYQLFYKEQFAATISVLENFLYCMVLRELIYNKEKLLNNVRTFNYGKDVWGLHKCITLPDDELFLKVTEVAENIVYHNWQAILLYRIIFQKDIQSYIDTISDEIYKRHNIVHRNGQKLNGEVEPINKMEVENFIDKVENITQSIWTLIKSE